MVWETKYIFPNFVTYVKRVFDGCQKLFCLFSKALVTVVKNFRNFHFFLMTLNDTHS